MATIGGVAKMFIYSIGDEPANFGNVRSITCNSYQHSNLIKHLCSVFFSNATCTAHSFFNDASARKYLVAKCVKLTPACHMPVVRIAWPPRLKQRP